MSEKMKKIFNRIRRKKITVINYGDVLDDASLLISTMIEHMQYLEKRVTKLEQER